MKKIFTIASLLMLSVFLITGCSKRGYNYQDDTDYWMSKESGIVVYSDGACPFYVVETNNGYTVVRSVGGYMPYEGDEIFGDLSRLGVRELYNYQDNSIIRGEVVDYWLSYAEAQFAVDDLCYTYSKTGEKKEIKKNLQRSATRRNAP